MLTVIYRKAGVEVRLLFDGSDDVGVTHTLGVSSEELDTLVNADGREVDGWAYEVITKGEVK